MEPVPVQSDSLIAIASVWTPVTILITVVHADLYAQDQIHPVQTANAVSWENNAPQLQVVEIIKYALVEPVAVHRDSVTAAVAPARTFRMIPITAEIAESYAKTHVSMAYATLL